MNRVFVILLVTSLATAVPSVARLRDSSQPTPDPAPSSTPAPVPPPAPSPVPTPPPPPPPCFTTVVAAYITYSDDVAALKAWFETLSSAEQQQYAAQYKAATDKLAAQEDLMVGLVTGQLDANRDSNLYVVFETIRGMDAIKARKIFGAALAKMSTRVNQDYLTNPSNADFARRARDMQAIRAYIGHPAPSAQ